MRHPRQTTQLAPQSTGSSSGKADNNSLYLFTFLTTLLLLLTVTFVIVFRSIVLRRRYRRRLGEDIAAGIIPPEGPPSEWGSLRQRVNFGPKPVMWEISLDELENVEKWQDFTPVSGLVVRSNANIPGLVHDADARRLRLPIGFQRIPLFRRPRTIEGRDPRVSATASEGYPLSSPHRHGAPVEGSNATPDTLFVSVVISLPDIQRPSYFHRSRDRADESPGTNNLPRTTASAKGKLRGHLHRNGFGNGEGLPDLALGVAERKWARGAAQKAVDHPEPPTWP